MKIGKLIILLTIISMSMILSRNIKKLTPNMTDAQVRQWYVDEIASIDNKCKQSRICKKAKCASDIRYNARVNARKKKTNRKGLVFRIQRLF